MGRPRRVFTREFKQEAVKLVTAGGQPTAQVARDLGSTPNLLRRGKPAVAARLTRDLACGTQERGFVTRGAAILRQAVGMRCQAMQAHTGRFLVRLMGRLLAVSPSGYPVWMAQPESRRTVENRRLLMEIRGIHAESRRTDGSPWVHPTLQAQGRRIGEHRVAAAV
ncbi:MAG: transposase, partial [Nitrospirota bacterium]